LRAFDDSFPQWLCAVIYVFRRRSFDADCIGSAIKCKPSHAQTALLIDPSSHALEHFPEKWTPVFRKKMRPSVKN